MEAGVDDSYQKARDRLTKTLLIEIREAVDKALNYTSFNVLPKFTPAQVEILLNHVERCHKILFEFSELNDHEFPYRCPQLIEEARALRRAIP